MAHQFRDKSPKRTCTKTFADYHSYKEYLANDFNHHCGYTHTADHWFGGLRTFQIDHLKPKTIYPKLENNYNNLVYCCSYVNRAKWDDDSPNYLDPCLVDYNQHFIRDYDGRIMPLTLEAEYMVSHLHLDLARYAIAWNLERLEQRVEKLKLLVSSHPEYKADITDFLFEYIEYIKSFRNYL